jgi:hypothetical protein
MQPSPVDAGRQREPRRWMRGAGAWPSPMDRGAPAQSPRRGTWPRRYYGDCLRRGAGGGVGAVVPVGTQTQ